MSSESEKTKLTGSKRTLAEFKDSSNGNENTNNNNNSNKNNSNNYICNNKNNHSNSNSIEPPSKRQKTSHNFENDNNNNTESSTINGNFDKSPKKSANSFSPKSPLNSPTKKNNNISNFDDNNSLSSPVMEDTIENNIEISNKNKSQLNDINNSNNKSKSKSNSPNNNNSIKSKSISIDNEKDSMERSVELIDDNIMNFDDDSDITMQDSPQRKLQKKTKKKRNQTNDSIIILDDDLPPLEGKNLEKYVKECGLNPYHMNLIETERLTEFVAQDNYEYFYLEIRNRILELWTRNEKKFLRLEDCMSHFKQDRFNALVSRIWDFLNQYGYINNGLLIEDKKQVIYKPLHSDKRKRIIIVGGGASGLAAARKLYSFGHDVTILESNNRLGGRCHTINLGNNGNFPVDLGASLITGIIGNPCSLLGRQLGVSYTIQHKNKSDSIYYENSDVENDLYDDMTIKNKTNIYNYDGKKIDKISDDKLETFWNLLLSASQLVRAKISKEEFFEIEGNQHKSKINNKNEHETEQQDYEYDTVRLALDEMSKSMEKLDIHNNIEILYDLIGLKTYDEINNMSLGEAINTVYNEFLDKNLYSLTSYDKNIISCFLANLEYGFGCTLNNVSLLYWNEDDEIGGFSGDHVMLCDGYSNIINLLPKTNKYIRTNLNKIIGNKPPKNKYNKKFYTLRSKNALNRRKITDGRVTKSKSKNEIIPLEDDENESDNNNNNNNKYKRNKDDLFPIYLNTQVSKIKWSSIMKGDGENGVTIYTKSGDTFRGDVCLVSTSIGVLQSDNIEFKPPLPKRKQEVINSFGMGNLNKLALKFNKKFWSDKPQFSYVQDVFNDGTSPSVSPINEDSKESINEKDIKMKENKQNSEHELKISDKDENNLNINENEKDKMEIDNETNEKNNNSNGDSDNNNNNNNSSNSSNEINDVEMIDNKSKTESNEEIKKNKSKTSKKKKRKLRDRKKLKEKLVFPNKRGRFFIWWNLELLTGEPILVSLISGDEANEIHKARSDEEQKLYEKKLVNEAINILKKIFKDKNVPNDVVSYNLTNWGGNKHSYGCYHYIKKGSLEGTKRKLEMKPCIDNVLFFCGEHCSYEYPDTVAGALLSGYEVAGDIEQINKTYPTISKIPVVPCAKDLKSQAINTKNDLPNSILRHLKRTKAKSKNVEKLVDSMSRNKNNNNNIIINNNNINNFNSGKDTVVRTDASVMINKLQNILNKPIERPQKKNKEILYDNYSPEQEINDVNSDKNSNALLNLGVNESNSSGEDNTVDLPKIESLIDNTELEDGDEPILIDDLLENKHRNKKSKNKHRSKKSSKHSSKSKHSKSSKKSSSKKSPSKHKRSKHSSSSSKNNKSKHKLASSSSSSSPKRKHNWIGGKNITESEEKEMMKTAKTEISHFIKRRLTKITKHSKKSGGDGSITKEQYKELAKKMTKKIFDDYRQKLKKKDKSDRKSFTIKIFMNTKVKKAIEDSIDKYLNKTKSGKS